MNNDGSYKKTLNKGDVGFIVGYIAIIAIIFVLTICFAMWYNNNVSVENFDDDDYYGRRKFDNDYYYNDKRYYGNLWNYRYPTHRDYDHEYSSRY